MFTCIMQSTYFSYTNHVRWVNNISSSCKFPIVYNVPKIIKIGWQYRQCHAFIIYVYHYIHIGLYRSHSIAFFLINILFLGQL